MSIAMCCHSRRESAVAFAVVPEIGPGFSPDIPGPPQNRALALGTCSVFVSMFCHSRKGGSV